MSEILTLAEIKTRYDSEWVLVAEPELDEHKRVVRGQVLWHSKDRDEVYRKDRELRPKSAAYLYTGKLPENTAIIL